jgi:hypothetical protein
MLLAGRLAGLILLRKIMSPRKFRRSLNRIQIGRCAATLVFALAAATSLSARAAGETDDPRPRKPTFGQEARPAKSTSGQETPPAKPSPGEDDPPVKPTPGEDKPPPNTTTLSVPLTGTGVQATVTFSAPSPLLTTAPADRKVKSGTITVTNTGTGPLTLEAAPSITRAGDTEAGKFSITGGSCSSGVVVAAAGGTCTISVRYTPANTRASTARVTLTDSGAAEGTQHSANFSGN